MRNKLLLIAALILGAAGYSVAEMSSVPQGNTGDLNTSDYRGVDWYAITKSTSIQATIVGECSIAFVHFNVATATGNYFVTINDTGSVILPDGGSNSARVFDIFYSSQTASNIGGGATPVGTGNKLGYTHFFRPPVHLRRGMAVRNSDSTLDVTIGATSLKRDR